MPCALLGDRASGKTTFLGLLYAAQVKYGTGVQDDFRFHAPMGSLSLMSAVYEGMKDARFPSATLKEEITELGFIFGYLRKVVGKLPYYIRNQNWVRPFSTLRFSAYDVSGEDIEEFIETGIASRPLIQQLLKSVVVVVLVDCSKMTAEIDTPAYKKMLRYDSTVAKLLVAFQTYKRQEYDRLKDSGVKADAPRIYPAFVLSKFDTLRDDVLARLGLHRGFPENKRARKDYAEALLRVFVPQTLSQIRGGEVPGPGAGSAGLVGGIMGSAESSHGSTDKEFVEFDHWLYGAVLGTGYTQKAVSKGLDAGLYDQYLRGHYTPIRAATAQSYEDPIDLQMIHPVRGNREILLSRITRGPPDEAGRPTFANHTVVGRIEPLRSGAITLESIYRALGEFDRCNVDVAGEMSLLRVPVRSEAQRQLP